MGVWSSLPSQIHPHFLTLPLLGLGRIAMGQNICGIERLEVTKIAMQGNTLTRQHHPSERQETPIFENPTSWIIPGAPVQGDVSTENAWNAAQVSRFSLSCWGVLKFYVPSQSALNTWSDKVGTDASYHISTINSVTHQVKAVSGRSHCC